MDLTGIILLIVGIGVGFALGWLLKKNNANTSNDNSNDTLNELNDIKNKLSAANARLEAATEVYNNQKAQIEKLSTQKMNCWQPTLNYKRQTKTLNNA